MAGDGTDMALLTSVLCEQTFGSPTPDCERKWMAVFATGVGAVLPIRVIPERLYCHRFLIEPFRDALELIDQRKLGQEIKTWDGCFNVRQKKGGKTLSLHAWALAVDLNAAWNQFGKPPTLSSALVACFREAGFDWGGEWATPDGMHMQLNLATFQRALTR